jgi:hypothetical protein
MAFYAYSLGEGGRPDECRVLCARIDTMRRRRFISGAYMALPLLALGDRDNPR